MIVTIDGPAGSGKSTAAKLLAERIGFERLDTGAMYRAVGWACLDQNVDLSDDAAVAEVAGQLQLRTEEGRWFVGDQDITDEIRSSEVPEAASRVATVPAVRSRLVELQQRFAEERDLVSDGRDQGTVVFPDAPCKFFLTASVDTRAQRRLEEYRRQGDRITLEEVISSIEARDRQDVDRVVSPLRPADDAVNIDTSALSIEEVVDRLETQVRSRMDIAPMGDAS